MSIDINWVDSVNGAGNHFLAQDYGRHVLLTTAQLTAAGIPDDGTQKFATLVYVVNITANIPINWTDSANGAGNHFLTQDYGRHVSLQTSSLTAAGLPNDGTQKFATMLCVINP